MISEIIEVPTVLHRKAGWEPEGLLKVLRGGAGVSKIQESSYGPLVWAPTFLTALHYRPLL